MKDALSKKENCVEGAGSDIKDNESLSVKKKLNFSLREIFKFKEMFPIKKSPLSVIMYPVFILAFARIMYGGMKLGKSNSGHKIIVDMVKKEKREVDQIFGGKNQVVLNFNNKKSALVNKPYIDSVLAMYDAPTLNTNYIDGIHFLREMDIDEFCKSSLIGLKSIFEQVNVGQKGDIEERSKDVIEFLQNFDNIIRNDTVFANGAVGAFSSQPIVTLVRSAQGTGGGECQDLVLLMYASLQVVGVPKENIKLFVGIKTGTNQGHILLGIKNIGSSFRSGDFHIHFNGDKYFTVEPLVASKKEVDLGDRIQVWGSPFRGIGGKSASGWSFAFVGKPGSELSFNLSIQEN